MRHDARWQAARSSHRAQDRNCKAARRTDPECRWRVCADASVCDKPNRNRRHNRGRRRGRTRDGAARQRASCRSRTQTRSTRRECCRAVSSRARSKCIRRATTARRAPAAAPRRGRPRRYRAPPLRGESASLVDLGDSMCAVSRAACPCRAPPSTGRATPRSTTMLSTPSPPTRSLPLFRRWRESVVFCVFSTLARTKWATSQTFVVVAL